MYESSYSWVADTAGKRHTTLLSAGVTLGTVEIDVHVPVIGVFGSTAVVLRKKRDSLHSL